MVTRYISDIRLTMSPEQTQFIITAKSRHILQPGRRPYLTTLLSCLLLIITFRRDVEEEARIFPLVFIYFPLPYASFIRCLCPSLLLPGSGTVTSFKLIRKGEGNFRRDDSYVRDDGALFPFLLPPQRAVCQMQVIELS
jgi:hypothetical protein